MVGDDYAVRISYTAEAPRPMPQLSCQQILPTGLEQRAVHSLHSWLARAHTTIAATSMHTQCGSSLGERTVDTLKSFSHVQQYLAFQQQLFKSLHA
jgi:hypothetical protein